jgi:hypothetical protein
MDKPHGSIDSMLTEGYERVPESQRAARSV